MKQAQNHDQWWAFVLTVLKLLCCTIRVSLVTFYPVTWKDKDCELSGGKLTIIPQNRK
jgi:hypothetical protein